MNSTALTNADAAPPHGERSDRSPVYVPRVVSAAAATVGLGFRSELAVDLMAAPRTVDFVEIVAETCYTQRATRREACAIREIWPVIPHGVKLSLGSAEGVDLERARRLGVLARELRAPMISEHASFTRAGGTDVGHLTQLPRTREAIRVLARNVDRVRRVLPDVPFLLENVAWSFLWPDDEMSEPAFYQELVRATGCPLLLDVGNLYANAVNEGRDPRAALLAYPLEHVAMVHVAGGVREHGFYFDTHAHPVPPEVLALVGELVARRPDVPVMIERDADIQLRELAKEIGAIRALPRGGDAFRTPGPPVATDVATHAQLAGDQAALALELAGLAEIGASTISQRIGRDPMVRSRSILERKRIDDALPMLTNLGRTPVPVRELAERVLARTPRAPRRAAPTDAWHIAEAALAEPALAAAARIDVLMMRARFAGRDREGSLKPRATPFIGFARTGDGRRVRATKGFGALAAVMMKTERV